MRQYLLAISYEYVHFANQYTCICAVAAGDEVPAGSRFGLVRPIFSCASEGKWSRDQWNITFRARLWLGAFEDPAPMETSCEVSVCRCEMLGMFRYIVMGYSGLDLDLCNTGMFCRIL
jgi:hypothetical protein